MSIHERVSRSNKRLLSLVLLFFSLLIMMNSPFDSHGVLYYAAFGWIRTQIYPQSAFVRIQWFALVYDVKRLRAVKLLTNAEILHKVRLIHNSLCFDAQSSLWCFQQSEEPMPTDQTPPTVFVCTLGGKPQIATLALDQLLAQDAKIKRVIAIHLASEDPSLRRSLDLLKHELETHYSPSRLRLESVAIRDVQPTNDGKTTSLGRLISSVNDRSAPDAIRLTLYELIKTLKRTNHGIEMCVSGGPRLMGFQALAVASLLFDSSDHCWHLFSSPELRAASGNGAILHVPQGSGTRLIPVPLVPMATLFPVFRELAYTSPEVFVTQHIQQLSKQDIRSCRDVYQKLKPRQRDVLRAFAKAKDALTIKQVAAQLILTEATVNSHKARIFAECRIAWNLSQLPPQFLREKFGRLPEDFWQ